MEFYPNDSFFTLTPWGRTGLIVLSTVLATAMVYLAWTIGGRLRRPPVLAPFLMALLSFWAFLWLSPQAYYAYYLWLFPDLPLQWVVGAPPSLEDVFQLLTFRGQSNLARLGQGLLAWSMAIAAIWAAYSKPHRQIDLDQSGR